MKDDHMKNKIVVVGSSNTDMIIQVPRIPKPKETILGGRFSMAAGGKGANQAVAAARAGGDVHFICRVGADMFGQKAIDGFVHDGINVDFVKKDEEASSGVALIFVSDDGENSIAVAPEANARLSAEDLRDAKEVIVSASIVVVQLEIPIETVRTLIEMAYESGVRVILNPAPAQKLDKDLLKHVSIITPNEIEAELLTGIKTDSQDGVCKAAEALVSMGIETVIITCGSAGAYYIRSESEGMIPAYRVDPIDTTAAGDIFNGALAAALADGKDLEKAIAFANAAAALSVTILGAQPSAPLYNDILNFMTCE
jgi:ribokinase